MHPRTFSDIELFPVSACPTDPKGVSCVAKHSVHINDIFLKKFKCRWYLRTNVWERSMENSKCISVEEAGK